MRRLTTLPTAMLAIALASFGESPAAAYQVAPKATLPTKTEAAKPKGEDGLVDINTADLETLQTLPGIGPVLAREIVAGRPYANVTQLSKVNGLGEAKLAELKGKVVAKRATPAPIPAAKPAAKTAAKKAGMPKDEAAAKSTVPRLAPNEKVNLNTATRDKLDALPGIGPAKAQAIIEARPFKTVEDVMTVKGIKQDTFTKIKEFIIVR